MGRKLNKQTFFTSSLIGDSVRGLQCVREGAERGSYARRDAAISRRESQVADRSWKRRTCTRISVGTPDGFREKRSGNCERSCGRGRNQQHRQRALGPQFSGRVFDRFVHHLDNS